MILFDIQDILISGSCRKILTTSVHHSSSHEWFFTVFHCLRFLYVGFSDVIEFWWRPVFLDVFIVATVSFLKKTAIYEVLESLSLVFGDEYDFSLGFNWDFFYWGLMKRKGSSSHLKLLYVETSVLSALTIKHLCRVQHQISCSS